MRWDTSSNRSGLAGRPLIVGGLAVVALVVAVVVVVSMRSSGPPIDGTRYADRLSIGGGDRAEVEAVVVPLDGTIVSEIDQQANPPSYLVVFPVGDIEVLIDIADRIEATSGLEASLVPAPSGAPLP